MLCHGYLFVNFLFLMNMMNLSLKHYIEYYTVPVVHDIMILYTTVARNN